MDTEIENGNEREEKNIYGKQEIKKKTAHKIKEQKKKKRGIKETIYIDREHKNGQDREDNTRSKQE